MEKRLKDYLAYLEKLTSQKSENPLDGGMEEEKKKIKEDLLVWISFFQHERFVHLIVTLTFALLTMFALIGSLLTQQPALLLLEVLFLVLLIPYIRHYYILENGVQKLYWYYDQWK